MTRLSALLSLPLLFSACAPTAASFVPRLRDAPPLPRASTEDAPFRAGPPPLGVDSLPEAPPVRALLLDDGLRLFVVERHGFPSVAARLSVDLSAADAGDAGGYRARLLNEVYVAPLGHAAQTASGCDGSTCAIATTAWSGALDQALTRLATLAAAPEDRSDVYARRRADAVDSMTHGPMDLQRRFVHAQLFGHDHRYGEASPTPLSLSELEAFRARALVPNRATLVVVGDVSWEEVRASTAAHLGSWTWKDTPAVPQPLPAEPAGPRVATLRDPNVSLVYALIAARGPAPGADDHAAFAVLTAMLGAPWSSVFHQTREEMAAAYEVGAATEDYPDTAIFTLGGQLESSKARDALAALLRQVAAARDADPEPDAVAKTVAISAYRQALGSNAALAFAIARAVALGLTPERYFDEPARIAAVTGADVRAVAQRYLGEASLRVSIIGRDVAFAGSLGLGAPQAVDFHGAPVPK